MMSAEEIRQWGEQGPAVAGFVAVCKLDGSTSMARFETKKERDGRARRIREGTRRILGSLAARVRRDWVEEHWARRC